jgi:MoxR-like ATPase
MSADAIADIEFTPLFDLRGKSAASSRDRGSLSQPDSRSGRIYRMPSALHLAVEVAMTTGRPLLLRGEPGTGKSSLAPYLARRLGWRYYEQVVTSTSMATDLLWRFDAVKRLAAAQAKEVRAETDYVSPGVLWWAFHRKSAQDFANRAKVTEPNAETNAKRDLHRAVVLIDEIDKAHPDLPNSLLVALGSNQIAIPYLDKPIEIQAEEAQPLRLAPGIEVSPVQVIITTNEERELPAAFVRRCITFSLMHPHARQLVEIARAHFHRKDRPFDSSDRELALAIAHRVEELRAQVKFGAHRPSTAEFLDAFRACRKRTSVGVSSSARP